ncbi:TonB-dependent receptor [Dysgonomonas sp. ZJ709]|uniref:SusC/RagA family TonB-linked outer membrane protein n=1 Tax=Dysgonomonas sp. ZJ709 TaxID=2709797 RepID=UPI0021062628|nr:TonB-dependent receptor [Dysgonomonas sp. ZJ709]
MKLLTVLLILSVNVALASSSYAQQATLSLDIKNQRVADILDEIEKQSDFHFYYNSRLVDVERKVSIKANKKAVLPILSEIFADSDVDYKVLDKDVILTEKDKSTIGSQSVTQQQNTVSGVVRDQAGETIPGVSVALKGTSVGTITDVDGAYSINVPNQDAILVFTFIGYLRQEEVVGSRKTLNISMKEDIKEMDEVVVIGYGTVKRANLAGAVSTTDSRTFQSRPVQNAANALQGEMPGLTVIRTSGAPGSSPTLRIRDMSSINGGSPLILIDGAEGDLNMINAADIENISVLKDGTAAIYGARAADGVILVTTKNANKNQKLKVTLDAFYSVKKPALLKKAASLYQHAVMGLEITDGSFPIEYTQDELQLILDGSDKVLPTSNWGRWSGYPKFYKDQDWNDIMIGNGNLQNYNVSLSGGGDKYSYLISLGHQNEEGLLKFGTDNDKRYFVRTKSNIQIVKNLDYDLNLSYEASSRNYSSGISEGQNIWELIYKTRSWAPLYNPAGNFYTFEGFDNPAQVLEDGGLSNITTGNFTINNQLRWKVIDGLNLIGRAVIRKNDSDKYSAMKMLYSYNWDDVNHRTARKPNSAERSYSKTLYKNFTLYGEYKKTFGKHDLGVMVGAANESSDFDKFWAKRINFDQQESMPINLGSPEDQDASSEGNAWTINSFFSRVNYGFANKYIIEGTLRADGCSRFDPDSRWGYFPGASAVWRVGEESFMKDLKLFDDLKFRASYGEMGNQSGISFYDYIELINISRSYYPFGNGQRGQMAQQSNLVSSSRTWETIASKNLGIDFSVLDNRLYGSFDYFWKKNKNMLIPITYPSMLGISAPATNSGELKINGWEVTLGWRDQIGDFSYSVRANVSDARNEVSKRIGNSLIGLGMNRTPVGYPMDSYFGYVFDGIIQNEQQLNEYKSRFPKNDLVQSKIAVGDAMYKDLDGDGNLTVLGDGTEGAGDMVYLGNTNPRYNFGLNLNAEYKGFDFGAFIQGVGKRTMFLEGEASKPFAAPWYQSAEYWYGKTWTPERTDAKYPAITNDGKKDYNYYVSTNTKHNVAYVRLKNLQFGYTIPKKHLQKFKLEKIRVYFSGEDLFEIHNAPGGWDPEEGGGYVSYPFARNYSLGVNIVF